VQLVEVVGRLLEGEHPPLGLPHLARRQARREVVPVGGIGAQSKTSVGRRQEWKTTLRSPSRIARQ